MTTGKCVCSGSTCLLFKDAQRGPVFKEQIPNTEHLRHFLLSVGKSYMASLPLSITVPLTSPHQSNPPAPGAFPCFGTARARAQGSPGDWAGTCRLSVARLHDLAQPRAKSELDVSPGWGPTVNGL